MPSTAAASLALVIPGFTQDFRRGLRWPSLAKLLAYCEQDALETELYPSHLAWQSELLRWLNLDATHASAPASWLGGNSFEAGTWMHVQPVSLAVGTHGLSLQSCAAWSDATRRAAEEAVSRHLVESGFEWRESQGNVYLRSDSALQVGTTALDAALREPLQDALPTGVDAVKLRRLMTELQMLVHDKPTVDFNALWLWGSGSIQLQKAVLPKLAANEPFARGLYASHQALAQCAPLPISAVSLLESQVAVAVVHASTEAFDRNWLEPLLHALEVGRLRSLHLYLDGYALHAKYSLMRRWFGRARPLELP
ncbi:MAG TPA: hypothetical protein VK629_20355 [Steroidobacteraceae bacterium]|nr:hypothetical protein [Steroidobacteraceae bacterium]